MNKRLFGLYASVLMYTGVAAQEQQKDTLSVQELDEVVVSDSRFQLKRENSGKTVIKITTEELERSQGKTVAEVINAKSGIEIAGSRGRDGVVLGVFARGGRGRQVLVVIDGVRISDPSSFSSEYDLRLLTPANIESIEIIKGAASTLYGTNAATAVINIITKEPSDKKISANFQSSFGTNQTAKDQDYTISDFSNSVRISGTLAKFTYMAGFTNRYTDGLSAIITPGNEIDDFSNISADLKLGYRFTEAFSIKLYGNQTKVNTAYDESFGLIDAPYEFISKQERIGLSTVLNYQNGAVYANVAFTDYDSENISAFPNSFKAKNYVMDLYNKYNFDNTFYTILGLNYINDQSEFAATKDFTIIDPYANVVYISPFGLNVNTGIRLNNHSEYGTNFIYNINPSFTYKMEGSYIKLLGSYATSYITPSLTQLFGDFGPNPNLEPEDNRTIELGLEYYISNKLRVSTLHFNRKEENFVFFDNATFGYMNAPNTIDAKGLEVELDWYPLDDLRFGANYTFTERKGDNAIRIPKHKLNASLSYNLSTKTSASLNYALTGERSDTDFNTFTDVGLPSFSIMDIYLDHEVLPGKLKLFLYANNIFNESYTEIFGFTTKGRNIRIGMNLKL